MQALQTLRARAQQPELRARLVEIYKLGQARICGCSCRRRTSGSSARRRGRSRRWPSSIATGSRRIRQTLDRAEARARRRSRSASAELAALRSAAAKAQAAAQRAAQSRARTRPRHRSKARPERAARRRAADDAAEAAGHAARHGQRRACRRPPAKPPRCRCAPSAAISPGRSTARCSRRFSQRSGIQRHRNRGAGRARRPLADPRRRRRICGHFCRLRQSRHPGSRIADLQPVRRSSRDCGQEGGACRARPARSARSGRRPPGPNGLYFELRVDGQPVDPLQWLKKR